MWRRPNNSYGYVGLPSVYDKGTDSGVYDYNNHVKDDYNNGITKTQPNNGDLLCKFNYDQHIKYPSGNRR